MRLAHEIFTGQLLTNPFKERSWELKKNGSKPCECGRTISMNKEKCAKCAGITDHPTAKRLERALVRKEDKNKWM